MFSRNRTLVVSHDPGLVNQARGAIQVLGGAVTAAPSGESAMLELAEGDVGLVVAATELPDLDGYELCRQLKAMEPAPLVVLLHAHADGSAARRASETGADATLGRPFAGAELARLLEKLAGKRFFTGVDSTYDSLQWPRAADSIIEPGTGVFPPTEGEVEIDHGESWASSVVSAAIRPLDSDEEDAIQSLGTGAFEAVGSPTTPEGAFSTQELPAQNLEAFDEANPVSVPVSATTTAHFRPLSDPGVEAPERPSTIAAASAGFLPPVEVDSGEGVTEAVREELSKLTAPEGELSMLIQQAVASAVTEAIKQVLPAVAAEAARIARDGD